MGAVRAERYEATVPVSLEHGKGVTRNVSSSGVYFETDQAFTAGSAVSFRLDFENAPGGPLRVTCEGKIVRVEQRDGKLGVAATITDYKFEQISKGELGSGIRQETGKQ